jgi:hypothetical protein
MLGELIDSVKAKTPTNSQTEKPYSPRLKQAAYQRTCARPQPEIHALDVKENADVLAVWNQYLLPSFPLLVQKALVQGSYSASLVRQEVFDGLHPVIRFRSSGNQSEDSRRIIREGVKKICLENRSPRLPVQFTEGTLVRLMGGSLEGKWLLQYPR